MRLRLVLTAAMLMSGAPALGQTDKPDPSKNERAQPRPGATGALVLASAETARSPAPAARQGAAMPKRVEPRITTCRCGDPQNEPDPDNQDQ